MNDILLEKSLLKNTLLDNQIFKIMHLSRYPEAIPLLAKWFRQEWPFFIELSYEELIDELKLRVDEHQLPLTYVAINHKREVCGTVSLDLEDMDSHPELAPWLASLYVEPNFRHQGIGKALVIFIQEIAKLQGFKKIYLYTPDQAQWYQRMGWKDKEKMNYKGKSVVVMEKLL